MAREKTKCMTSIGGQALIEGIMMRGPQKTAVAVRLPDKTIETEYLEIKTLRDKYPLFRAPLLRGIAGFIDSLSIGYRALMLSAEKSDEETGEEEMSRFDAWIDRKFGDKAMKAVTVTGTVLGVALAVLLFFVLPTWIYNLIGGVVPFMQENQVLRSLIEGVMRLAIFIGYVILCSQVEGVGRVFEYHGAEHKTIFCYENEEPLTVENVKKHSRFHPRCGTSFMIFMLVLGILIGVFIPFTNPFLRSFTKILLIPLVVALGYEVIRFCGRHDNLFTRIISAPGMWVQRITTKEPKDDMIEVAIQALEAVIPENGEDKLPAQKS